MSSDYTIDKIFDPNERYYELSDDPNDIYDTLIEALYGVIFYNDLEDDLLKTRAALADQLESSTKGGVGRLDELSGEGHDQFEIFWMLLVQMFGDYGASPRYGWVNYDRLRDAMEFIDILLKEKK